MPGIIQAYRKLADALGPSNWWPGETPFEVMVGAILTQNTSWKNVELAIAQLRSRNLLDPERLDRIETSELAPIIRSSGYFNQKARKLKTLTNWFRNYNYSVKEVLASHKSVSHLRASLLALNGVGPETADSILCYAFEQPVFVVDAYTTRWLKRYAPELATDDYHELQKTVMLTFERAVTRAGLSALPLTAHYNEFHALIVRLGYQMCTKNKPACLTCPLRRHCNEGKQLQCASRSATRTRRASSRP
ncbi:MAG: hypothetical protein JNM27_12810 [Leptospirales bacterium]|nr:hypothetical protein [Leptospirales bacterium]